MVITNVIATVTEKESLIVSFRLINKGPLPLSKLLSSRHLGPDALRTLREDVSRPNHVSEQRILRQARSSGKARRRGYSWARKQVVDFVIRKTITKKKGGALLGSTRVRGSHA